MTASELYLAVILYQLYVAVQHLSLERILQCDHSLLRYRRAILYSVTVNCAYQVVLSNSNKAAIQCSSVLLFIYSGESARAKSAEPSLLQKLETYRSSERPPPVLTDSRGSGGEIQVRRERKSQTCTLPLSWRESNQIRGCNHIYNPVYILIEVPWA